eukprot:8693804-Alexandrium_andersonii.AAC.1
MLFGIPSGFCRLQLLQASLLSALAERSALAPRPRYTELGWALPSGQSPESRTAASASARNLSQASG